MSGPAGPGPPAPVTVVLSRRVRPGHEQAFEAVLGRLAEAAVRFPGHQGVSVLRPTAGGATAYTIVVHFRSRPELDTWLRSEERGRLLAEADRHADGELEVQEVSGLEGWFRVPGSPVVVPPPRWKMALVTWVAILPLVEVLGQLLVPRLGALPVWLRPVPVTAISILLMTYLLVPQLTRLLRPWLYAGGGSAGAREHR